MRCLTLLPGCSDTLPAEGENRCFQIIRPSGVIRDQLLAKTPLAISWNEKVKLSIPGIELPLIVTVPAMPGSVPLNAVLFIAYEVVNSDLRRLFMASSR